MPDEKPPTLIAITVEGKFNQSRTVVFQTTIPLDADPKDIYKEFSKVCEVMDRREEFYLLKGLKITLERETAQLADQVQKVEALENSYRNEWMASGRKGEYRLAGQQKTNVENQRASIQGGKDRLDKIKSEIAELEALQKAYE